MVLSKTKITAWIDEDFVDAIVTLVKDSEFENAARGDKGKVKRFSNILNEILSIAFQEMQLITVIINEDPEKHTTIDLWELNKRWEKIKENHQILYDIDIIASEEE